MGSGNNSSAYQQERARSLPPTQTTALYPAEPGPAGFGWGGPRPRLTHRDEGTPQREWENAEAKFVPRAIYFGAQECSRQITLFTIPPRVEAQPEATEIIFTKTVSHREPRLCCFFRKRCCGPAPTLQGDPWKPSFLQGSELAGKTEGHISLLLTHVYWSWWGF